jgi:uncharacterized protein YjbJ (UPF0337 family)
VNNNLLKDKWNQIREAAKVWWGKLTDDDLEKVDGKFDILADLLQEKYGYTRAHATGEIEMRLTEYETGLKRATPSA